MSPTRAITLRDHHGGHPVEILGRVILSGFIGVYYYCATTTAQAMIGQTLISVFVTEQINYSVMGYGLVTAIGDSYMHFLEIARMFSFYQMIDRKE